MERKDVRKISLLLDQFVQEHHLEQGLAENRILRSWNELLGNAIARKTRKIFIRKRKLFVYLHSSVARNELTLIKDSLIPKLNEAAGMKVIDDIIFR